MAPAAVVTCFLRHGGEVLLIRRAEDADTYPGRWAGVSGYVEHEDPLATARMEVREETALTDVELVRSGEPFVVEDGPRAFEVHPFLFEASSRDVRPNEEVDRVEWVPATEMLDRETVPRLWEAYDRVRPTPGTVADDAEHGSAYLSIRALEALRDAAGLARRRADDGAFGDVVATAEALLGARPGMAALENRVNRAMAGANAPAEVERAAVDAIGRAARADAAAAREAADRLPDAVLTLSRSGTVLTALREAAPAVVVAESRPAREGVDVAETLARDGLEATVCTDAAVAHLLSTGAAGAVLVGADAVLPDGRVVNKTGTRAAALAARREGAPLYVAAAADKVATDADPRLESGPPGAVYDGDAPLEATNPTFDVTPADCVAAVVTERGALGTDEVGALAAELRGLAAWREGQE